MYPFRALPSSSVGHENSAMLRKTVGQNNGEILGIASSVMIVWQQAPASWSVKLQPHVRVVHEAFNCRLQGGCICFRAHMGPRQGDTAQMWKMSPRHDSRGDQAPDLMAAGSLVRSFIHAISECTISLHRWVNTAWHWGLATGRL